MKFFIKLNVYKFLNSPYTAKDYVDKPGNINTMENMTFRKIKLDV